MKHYSKRGKAALFSGLGLIAMALVAGVAYGAIHGRLVVDGVAAASRLWLAEIALWLVIALLDVIVSLGLLSLFSGTHRAMARWMAGARLVYTLFLVAAAAQLLGGLDPESAQAALAAFERTWYLGLVVFGAHISLLAVLAFKSGIIPRVISVLLAIAGPAYTLIHLLFLAGGRAGELGLLLQKVLMLPMTLAELGLAVRLVYLFVRRRSTLDAADEAAVLSGSATRG